MQSVQLRINERKRSGWEGEVRSWRSQVRGGEPVPELIVLAGLLGGGGHSAGMGGPVPRPITDLAKRVQCPGQVTRVAPNSVERHRMAIGHIVGHVAAGGKMALTTALTGEPSLPRRHRELYLKTHTLKGVSGRPATRDMTSGASSTCFIATAAHRSLKSRGQSRSSAPQSPSLGVCTSWGGSGLPYKGWRYLPPEGRNSPGRAASRRPFADRLIEQRRDVVPGGHGQHLVPIGRRARSAGPGARLLEGFRKAIQQPPARPKLL